VFLTLTIREILPATPRARIVRLELGGRRFGYQPGQAVMVGSHAQPKRKPYSLASAPEDAVRDGALELLVGLEADGSAGDHLALAPGEMVDVDGPIGGFVFPDRPRERRFLFVAGGTGIAPLRAMLRHALRLEHAEIGLLYSARTPTEFAYREELATLARAGAIDLRQTVTRASDHDWFGSRGRITRTELAPLVHDPETLCFVCGPPSLVDDIPRALVALGIARERIRIEEWG
jgi:ferredoxin-NADP reductase